MTPEWNLRNLRPLAVENLAHGRITRDALAEAAKRIGFDLPINWEVDLVEELNDMLEAARLQQKKEVEESNKELPRGPDATKELPRGPRA